MNQASSKPAVRPRSKSRFSFRSDKSGGSSHKRKESLTESSAEKKKTHMSSTTKANPNAAINEAQPIALALEKPTITSLKDFRCNDLYGNPISDPDQNNPTRWRMERPLDTIRSFELAIDRAHAHRQSTYMLTDQTPFTPPNRRTSSQMSISHQQHGGYDHGARHPNAGYGPSRSRESFGDFAGHNGNSGQHSHYGTPQNGYSPNGFDGRFDMRKRSDPALSRGAPGVYPAVGNSRSKDTLATGGSASSEHWNNSTGPTSEEGSIERANGLARPMASHKPSNGPDTHYGLADNYGYSDEDRGRPRQPLNGHRSQTRLPPAPYMTGNPQQNGRAPRPPIKEGPTGSMSAPMHIQLSTPAAATSANPPTPQKRQSWLKRTFSSKRK